MEKQAAPKVENSRMTEVAKTLEFARDIMLSIGKDNNEAISQDQVELLFNTLRFQAPHVVLLRGQRIGSQTAAILYRKLQFTELTTLDLFDNQLGDFGIGAVLKVKTRRLNVGFNGVGDQGCLSLGQQLQTQQQQGSQRLECLELGTGNDYVFGRGKRRPGAAPNAVTPRGLAVLFRALAPNTTLKYLGVGGLSLAGPDGSTALAHLLANNQVLLGLDISDTGIDDNGAADLARGLALNRSLKYLNLGDNRLSFVSIPLIAQVLHAGSEISDLILSNNPLTSQGARALAYGLRDNQSIRRLDVSGCGLGDEGVELLIRVLAGLLDPQLEQELGEDVANSLGPEQMQQIKPENILNKQNQGFNLVDQVQRTGAKSEAPRLFLLQSADGKTLKKTLLRPGTGTYQHLNEGLGISSSHTPGRNSSQPTIRQRPSTTRSTARDKYSRSQNDEESTYLTSGATEKIEKFNRIYDAEMESVTFSPAPGAGISRPKTSKNTPSRPPRGPESHLGRLREVSIDEKPAIVLEDETEDGGEWDEDYEQIGAYIEENGQSNILNLNLASNGAGEAAISCLCQYLMQPTCQIQQLTLSGNILSNKSCFELASAFSYGLIQPDEFDFLLDNFDVPTTMDIFDPPFTFKEVYKLPGYREPSKAQRASSRPGTAGISRPGTAKTPAGSRPNTGRPGTGRPRTGRSMPGQSPQRKLTVGEQYERGAAIFSAKADISEPVETNFSTKALGVTSLDSPEARGSTFRSTRQFREGTAEYEEQIKRFKESQLYSLNLQDCHISDMGFAALALVLTKLPNLTTLNLKNNFISSTCNNFLVALTLSESLTAFNLDGNQIAQSVILKIKAKCEANKTRLTMNAPLKMKEKIVQIKQTVIDLPMKLHEDDFYINSNNYLVGMIQQIDQQGNECFDQFSRQQGIIQDRQAGVQDIINQNQQQIKQYTTNNENLEQQLKDDKERYANILQEDNQQLEEMNKSIEEKQQQIEQGAIDAVENVKKTKQETEDMTAEIAQIRAKMKEYEQMIKESMNLFGATSKIKAAISSQFCQKLQLFGEYQQLLAVVDRNIAIRTNNVKTIKVTGYNIDEFKLDKKPSKKKKTKKAAK